MNTKPSDHLNTEQAAEHLGCSYWTLIDWRRNKRGPAYMKIGGMVRYAVADLDAWVQANRVEAGGAA